MGRRARPAALVVKRVFDVCWATAALIGLAPVLLVVAVVVRVSLGSPVLFRQQRPGLHGRPFTIYKFRSMREPRPDEVWYLTDDARITRVGRAIRSSSLDELPELWNVVRGEMSLVGPRPLLMEYLDDYTPEEHRRHDMRPGITGWAAVNGRNTVQFRERLEMDLWYVSNWSLLLDLRIIARTALHLIRRESVTATEDLALGFPLELAPDAAADGSGEEDARQPTPH
jgi:sugar transferase EpsL